jgi:hypothetical protein
MFFVAASCSRGRRICAKLIPKRNEKMPQNTKTSNAGLGKKLPREREAFAGVIGRTVDESKIHRRRVPQAPEGAPNILLVMLDDAGYAIPAPSAAT